jgi:hypothetical protein
VVSQDWLVVRAIIRGHPEFHVSSPADGESLPITSRWSAWLQCAHRHFSMAAIGLALGVGLSEDGSKGHLQRFQCDLSDDGTTRISKSPSHRAQRRMILAPA